VRWQKIKKVIIFAIELREKRPMKKVNFILKYIPILIGAVIQGLVAFSRCPFFNGFFNLYCYE